LQPQFNFNSAAFKTRSIFGPVLLTVSSRKNALVKIRQQESIYQKFNSRPTCQNKAVFFEIALIQNFFINECVLAIQNQLSAHFFGDAIPLILTRLDLSQ